MLCPPVFMSPPCSTAHDALVVGSTAPAAVTSITFFFLASDRNVRATYVRTFRPRTYTRNVSSAYLHREIVPHAICCADVVLTRCDFFKSICCNFTNKLFFYV